MSIIQKTLNELQRRLQVVQGKRLIQKELAILAQTSDRTIAEWMRGATSPQAMAALLNLLVELPPNEATAVLEYWKVHAPKKNPPRCSAQNQDRASAHHQASPNVQGDLMKEIRFYRANEKPYGAFSNLYKREITFEGEVFKTAEHAYQAGKARKPEVRQWLMAAPSPSLLAMAAHGLYVWDITPEWSKIKFDRMKGILVAKYTQYDDLKDLLLNTGDARLIESATVDSAVNRLWGEVNGVGQNKLGQLLMEVREELLEAQHQLMSESTTPSTQVGTTTTSTRKRRSTTQPAA